MGSKVPPDQFNSAQLNRLKTIGAVRVGQRPSIEVSLSHLRQSFNVEWVKGAAGTTQLSSTQAAGDNQGGQSLSETVYLSRPQSSETVI